MGAGGVKRGGGEGKRGMRVGGGGYLRTIVSPLTMSASEKALRQSLQQPGGTHGNTYRERDCGLSGEGGMEGDQ